MNWLEQPIDASLPEGSNGSLDEGVSGQLSQSEVDVPDAPAIDGYDADSSDNPDGDNADEQGSKVLSGASPLPESSVADCRQSSKRTIRRPKRYLQGVHIFSKAGGRTYSLSESD